MKKYGGQDQGSCVGDQGICIQFYDSAPGGEFGTMAYLTRATSNVVNFPEDLVLDCTIMWLSDCLVFSLVEFCRRDVSYEL